MDAPRAVAEVAPDLAEDGGHRVARERRPVAGVEAVDRLQQADRAGLDEVVERLVGVRVALREVPHERQVALGELRANVSLARREAPERGRLLDAAFGIHLYVPVPEVPPLHAGVAREPSSM